MSNNFDTIELKIKEEKIWDGSDAAAVAAAAGAAVAAAAGVAGGAVDAAATGVKLKTVSSLF